MNHWLRSPISVWTPRAGVSDLARSRMPTVRGISPSRTTERHPVHAWAILLGLLVASPAAALTAAPGDPQTLEQAWHSCIREAFAHQPTGQSQAGNERNALDECRAHEDALVAALMTERPRSMWARAWTTISEPMTNWLGRLWH